MARSLIGLSALLAAACDALVVPYGPQTVHIAPRTPLIFAQLGRGKVEKLRQQAEAARLRERLKKRANQFEYMNEEEHQDEDEWAED